MFCTSHEKQDDKVQCRICGERVDERLAVSCDKCNAPYHDDCWSYYGRCSIYGCGSESKNKCFVRVKCPKFEIDENTRPEFAFGNWLYHKLVGFVRSNRPAIFCFSTSVMLFVFLCLLLSRIQSECWELSMSGRIQENIWGSSFHIPLLCIFIGSVVVDRVRSSASEAIKIFPLALFMIAFAQIVQQGLFNKLFGALWKAQFISWMLFYLFNRSKEADTTLIFRLFFVWHFLFYKVSEHYYCRWYGYVNITDKAMCLLVLTAVTVWLPICLTMKKFGPKNGDCKLAEKAL